MRPCGRSPPRATRRCVLRGTAGFEQQHSRLDDRHDFHSQGQRVAGQRRLDHQLHEMETEQRVVDLPGFTKDEIKASLENGYLTISAEKGLDKDEQEKESGHYIRRERYAGACSRSFYVGEDVQQEDIKAEFKHGILKLFVPKKEAKPAVEEKKHIAIEG